MYVQILFLVSIFFVRHMMCVEKRIAIKEEVIKENLYAEIIKKFHGVYQTIFKDQKDVWLSEILCCKRSSSDNGLIEIPTCLLEEAHTNINLVVQYYASQCTKELDKMHNKHACVLNDLQVCARMLQEGKRGKEDHVFIPLYKLKTVFGYIPRFLFWAPDEPSRKYTLARSLDKCAGASYLLNAKGEIKKFSFKAVRRKLDHMIGSEHARYYLNRTHCPGVMRSPDRQSSWTEYEGLTRDAFVQLNKQTFILPYPLNLMAIAISYFNRFKKKTCMITITSGTGYYVKNFINCKPQLYLCRSNSEKVIDLLLSYQVTDVRYRHLLQKMKKLQNIFGSPDRKSFYCGMHEEEEGTISISLQAPCCLYSFACNCSLYKKSGFTFQINTNLLLEVGEHNIFGTVYQDSKWKPFRKLLANDKFCDM